MGGNRSNYCYANSLAIVLLHMREVQRDMIFPGAIDRLLRRLKRDSKRHLWDNVEWTSHAQGWLQPSAQHDAAEFGVILYKGQCRQSGHYQAVTLRNQELRGT